KRFLTSAAALTVALAVTASARAQSDPFGDALQRFVDNFEKTQEAKERARSRPDLIISSVNVTGSTARVTLKNQGRSEAGLSRMAMKIFVKGKLVKTLFAAMPTIAPGQSAVVDLDARPLNLRAPGTKLVIQADDAGNVAEANEANNFKVVNSGVSAPPPPGIGPFRRP